MELKEVFSLSKKMISFDLTYVKRLSPTIFELVEKKGSKSIKYIIQVCDEKDLVVLFTQGLMAS